MGMAFLVEDEAVEAVEGGNEHFDHTSLWPEHFTRFSPAQTLSLTPELTGVFGRSRFHRSGREIP